MGDCQGRPIDYVRGCRCGVCLRGYVQARKRREMGWTGLVDASRVRLLFRDLQSQGLTDWDISHACGLTRSQVWQVRTGGAKKIRRVTERRALTVDYGRHPGGRLSEVELVGVRRRLQSLAVMRWATAHLVAETGVCKTSLEMVRNGRGGATRVTADRIIAAYDRLADTWGPARESVRTIALQRGWVPPAAWDDIDDPDEVPSVGVLDRKRSREYLTREAAWLEECGEDRDVIASRLGIHRDTVDKYLDRARRQATG